MNRLLAIALLALLPATVLQLLAAGLLEEEKASCMTLVELASECARYGRAEASEKLERSGK